MEKQSSTDEHIKSNVIALLQEAMKKTRPYNNSLANEIENIIIKLWNKTITTA